MCAGHKLQPGRIRAGVGRRIEAGENIWKSETDREPVLFLLHKKYKEIDMENGIRREEHEEFARRMEDEHKRISHRLTDLEENVRQIGQLTASVEKLAVSVESMAKTQTRQGERLEELEGRDGEMWRKVIGYVITAVIGIVVGYIFTQIGM